jgi:parallel beta-helix repeat protein
MKRFLTVVLVFLMLVPASATIINVPDDQPTIQAGINASTSGDTVRVAPGTYVENINFNGRNIVVGSWFLDDADPSYISSTIIDGNQAGSVVVFANGEDNTAVITGLTIQNGFTAQNGGGIYCYYSNPTIINNIINGNSAGYFGGGILCQDYSNPTITDNTINGNSADQQGGGICCNYNSNPAISDNTITGNSADFYGGGIYCAFSNPVITNTIFWGDGALFGPEIYLYGTSTPIITYCDIQGGWAGEGNIDCDPMFCDPENGNYYLDRASCCVDAGEGGADIGAYGVGCGIPITINIPADYETIQEGIDASSHGDTVRVAPGTYIENIDFSGKNIVVGSWFLDAGDPSYISSTIIDGNEVDRVVGFSSGETNDAKIIGFTIQNGHATHGGGIACYNNSNPTINYNTINGNAGLGSGGGIHCEDSSPAITNNTISGNTGYFYGGGIYCSGSAPTITNNIINGNSADEDGGGIYCYGSNPTITDNTITENSANVDGGGICCYYSSPEITNNTITQNSAEAMGIAGGGGAICCWYSSPTINYNTIIGNSSGENGGGVYCDGSSNPTVSSNTINGNTAYVGGGIFCFGSSVMINYNTIIGNSAIHRGGGICCYSSSPEIGNNTITENSSDNEGGGICCYWESSPVITNTIFWGDSAPSGPEIYLDETSSPVITYCDVQGSWEGEGNIDCDPMFCYPDTANYYLYDVSCCVGAGEGGADIGAYGVGCEITIPTILSVVPSQNELNVPVDSDISVTFDTDMDESTINSSSFIIHAMTTGLHEGAIAYDAPSKTGTLNPIEDFAEGEIVSVVLTEGIESSEGVPLEDPSSWSFTTAVNDGSGEFVIDGYYTVDSPGSIFSSDFDGDGDMDLAVNNVSVSTVSVCLNEGDGTFAGPVAYPTGNTPYGLFAGDFDADGDMDLATSSVADWTVSVLMNNGDGTFAPRVNHVLDWSAFPASVFGGDLNGDGYLDLVTPNLNDDNVSVLPNNGDGSFGAYSNFAVGDRPRQGFASDLDNDGDIDLAVTNSWEPYVSVLLNDGDGTFATQMMYEVISQPGSVFASDFDGDGYNDLATSNYDTDKICILLNSGDGTFTSYSIYSVGDGPGRVLAGDFDGDGDIDLITSNDQSDDISVLLNNGDGTFALQNIYPAGNGPGNPFASDFDGDGDLDIATGNYAPDCVTILLNAPLCDYIAGDCNHNGVPLELGDVVTMIGMYRGTAEPEYTCDCPPHGDTFAPEADPNGNCVALELGDVVTEIGAYRGTAEASGCADCPPSSRLLPGDDEELLITPNFKTRSNSKPASSIH